ncbi:GAF domain-containing protein [Burkholderia sp. YR290]|jgi:GAF domain-containing protein|uniref:GAF domain-containing protein n=1 Tax=Paraburkholderia hospita TaxID=169430 RepID=UPI0009A5AF59|nr:GAF domain-containing protein [Paraburkholderia hospita]SKC87909.1 GAF domain-containing protein [Paraburkholderia hospita]SOE85288.1 GAF domain-containing protein [Burkholderia sp. YR290]
MFEATINTALPKAEFYQELVSQARSLLEGESNQIANAANLSALIFHSLPELNWAGFYFALDGELVVGPFQGKPACVRIPMGRGVCGRAAETRETQVVPDVDAFPGHIACDSASRSEIVIPLQKANGELFGVLDIDSPVLARFDDEDRRGLEEVARIFVASLH